MSTRKSKLKPSLVQVGKHLINPNDVSAIRAVIIKAKRDVDPEGEYYVVPTRTMYIIDRISCPRPEYTLWAKESEIQTLIKQFRVIG
jgi:hypothetical protein